MRTEEKETISSNKEENAKENTEKWVFFYMMYLSDGRERL